MAERTSPEVEAEVLRRADDGESLIGISRECGVTRNTVKAILARHNRQRGLHLVDLQVRRHRREVQRFSHHLTRYLNRQPNTPERAEIFERLGELEHLVGSKVRKPNP